MIWPGQNLAAKFSRPPFISSALNLAQICATKTSRLSL
ncbi:hypothetical protein CAMSH0001_1910 [Campylobacter showae RM3277]|uniref:Uncharacterized protein n=1 Tax=Campylobacter showae RM3277 TaxID=553219 RepID=C6RE19_9BACT|nr:hypothetical protein CAMSH0001_1910 [Campylobacter showae RM3277]